VNAVLVSEVDFKALIYKDGVELDWPAQHDSNVRPTP